MINVQIRYKIENTFGMLYLKENAYYKNIMIWMIILQKVFLNHIKFLYNCYEIF